DPGFRKPCGASQDLALPRRKPLVCFGIPGETSVKGTNREVPTRKGRWRQDRVSVRQEWRRQSASAVPFPTDRTRSKWVLSMLQMLLFRPARAENNPHTARERMMLPSAAHLVFLFASLVTLSTFMAKADDLQIARGKYLVTIGGCNDCH